MQEEKNLIDRIKLKDENAFATLYDNYAPALYGVIVRICKDEQYSQNVLQDTFLTIWDKAHQYNPDKGRFYTWAYRIARNKSLNFIRKSKKLIQNEDLSVYDNEMKADEIKAPNYKLNGSIKRLQEHHQKAIDLVYFQGLTHREAHEKMDVPLGTFKSYIKQALDKIKINYTKIVVGLIFILEVLR